MACRKIIAPSNKFCNRACQSEAAYRSFIKQWKQHQVNGSRGIGNISRHIRRYLFEKYDSRCAKCQWRKRHPTTGNIPLEIEHIDGDWSNHYEDNLTLLCPNCHSLTPTYRALNKGRGRLGR
jgi:predicted restriction endonuclease